MPTVVIGTAGHIDHGKTSLLRALTGIDADRLPEERERGMTIDVGYAHLDLEDGSSLDFVDVPGHDRLIGNMLVGAGEIDAAMLVVAADDGPRPQTFEHLELVDALRIRDGLAVVTKTDLVAPERVMEVVEAVRALVARTTLEGAPVLAASAATGVGIEEVRDALIALRGHVRIRELTRPAGPLRLAIDRVFAIKGRGTVVTGTLRGGQAAVGDRLRLEPGGPPVRIREVQVHNAPRASHDGGRTALNLVGVDATAVRRGQVLTNGPGIEPTDRLLAALRAVTAPALLPGSRLRLHLGTEQVDATIGRAGRGVTSLPDGRSTAILRLGSPVATFVGDRAVLRRPSPGGTLAGVEVLDPHPPAGVGRRRVNPERLAALASAIEAGDIAEAADALVRLHGALPTRRIAALRAALRPAAADAPASAPEPSIELVLAADVSATLEARAIELVEEHHADDAVTAGLPAPQVLGALAVSLRRHASIERGDSEAGGAAIRLTVDDLVRRGRLIRAGDRLRPAGRPGANPALEAAMTRLEGLLSVAAPPGLATAARAAGCPPDGIQALLAAGRLTRLDRDLAWATPTYHRLAGTALAMARRGPLTPAAFRDATGTSRRFVLAILEDLDRREILRRTPEGHLPGPRAPAELPA